MLALTTAACGSGADTGKGSGKADGEAAARKVDPTRIPGVGDPLQKKIPREARQVVAVYGEGKDSADATVRLYAKGRARSGTRTALVRAQREEGLDPQSP